MKIRELLLLHTLAVFLLNALRNLPKVCVLAEAQKPPWKIWEVYEKKKQVM